MRSLVWILALVLAVLHYDFWYWDDRSLVFGFVPIGLASNTRRAIVDDERCEWRDLLQ